MKRRNQNTRHYLGKIEYIFKEDSCDFKNTKIDTILNFIAIMRNVQILISKMDVPRESETLNPEI